MGLPCTTTVSVILCQWVPVLWKTSVMTAVPLHMKVHPVCLLNKKTFQTFLSNQSQLMLRISSQNQLRSLISSQNQLMSLILHLHQWLGIHFYTMYHGPQGQVASKNFHKLKMALIKLAQDQEMNFTDFCMIREWDILLCKNCFAHQQPFASYDHLMLTFCTYAYCYYLVIPLSFFVFELGFIIVKWILQFLATPAYLAYSQLIWLFVDNSFSVYNFSFFVIQCSSCQKWVHRKWMIKVTRHTATCASIPTLLSQWDSLILQEGVLHWKFHYPDGSTNFLQIILPAKLRHWYIEWLHADLGHFGQTKTCYAVCRRIYFPG